MRFIVIVACAALLLIPTAGSSRAGSASGLANTGTAVDLSSAKKKRVKKAAAKEQYLRAVPSTPPAGAKQ